MILLSEIFIKDFKDLKDFLENAIRMVTLLPFGGGREGAKESDLDSCGAIQAAWVVDEGRFP